MTRTIIGIALTLACMTFTTGCQRSCDCRAKPTTNQTTVTTNHPEHAAPELTAEERLADLVLSGPVPEMSFESTPLDKALYRLENASDIRIVMSSRAQRAAAESYKEINLD